MNTEAQLFSGDQVEAVDLMLPEEACLVRPVTSVGVGVLVLLGASAPMDRDRARLLAEHGAHAMALRWFGGEHQPPGICEIPLEVFVRALDRLESEGVERLAVVAESKGAEAALLLACIDDRLALTVAMSPSSVVWANVGAGLDGEVTPYRSSWTWRGEPLPFVAYDSDWTPDDSDGPIRYRALYESSLNLDPVVTEAAAIPIEEASGDLLLAAGHDDQLWPSEFFVRELADRRLGAEGQVEMILNEHAGHRPVFPGQAVLSTTEQFDHGGTAEANGELGAAVWEAIVQRLGLI